VVERRHFSNQKGEKGDDALNGPFAVGYRNPEWGSFSKRGLEH